jgi:hypothetical protein
LRQLPPPQEEESSRISPFRVRRTAEAFDSARQNWKCQLELVFGSVLLESETSKEPPRQAL